MSMRKCPKCGSTWSSALVNCAFCGVEGAEFDMPVPASRLNIGPGNPHQAKVEEKPASAVAVSRVEPVAVSPVEPDAVSPIEPRPAPVEAKAPIPEEPKPVPVVETPPERPTEKLEPRPVVQPVSAAPPAPLLPSATAPLVFGVLGAVAWLTLPLLAWMGPQRVLETVALLAWAVLAPFAPSAWLAGRRYEDRCGALGFRPAPAARTGRLLGMSSTFILILEVSVIAFLLAVQRLSGPSVVGALLR